MPSISRLHLPVIGPAILIALTGSLLVTSSPDTHKRKLDPDPTLQMVQPSLFRVEGGSGIAIFGQEFRQGLRVLINGAEVQNLVLDDPNRLRGTVPPNPAGIHDVVLQDAQTQQVLSVLPQAVEYQQALLPPPLNVEAARSGNQVRLTWSSLVAYEQIHITGPNLDIDLPGPTTQHTIDITGAQPGMTLTYHLTGQISNSTSYETTVNAIGPETNFSCLRYVTSPPAIMGAGWTQLFSQPANETHTFFRVFQVLDTGLHIRVHAARLEPLGTLQARIYPAADPGSPLATGITFTEPPGLYAPQWCEADFNGPVPPGDYVIEFYAQGGDLELPCFGVSSNSLADDAGPPFPCLPYALATIEPLTCAAGGSPIVAIDQKLLAMPAGSDPDNTMIGLFARTDDGGASTSQYTWTVTSDDGAALTAPAVPQGNPFYAANAPKVGGLKGSATAYAPGGPTWTRAVTCPAGRIPFIINAPPGEGMPPHIHRPTPSPYDVRFIPGIASLCTVTPRFDVRVEAATGATVTSVSMQFEDYTTGSVVLGPVTAELTDSTTTNGIWSVSTNPSNMMNISAVPRCQNAWLKVIAHQSSGVTGTTRYRVMFCEAPCIIDQSYVGTKIDYSPLDARYTLDMRVPPKPLYKDDFSLFGKDLHNELDAKLATRILMTNGEWTGDPITASVLVKLLNEDLYNKSWTTPGTPFGNSCPYCDMYWYLSTPQRVHDTLKLDVFILNDQFITSLGPVPIYGTLHISGSYDTWFTSSFGLLRDDGCMSLNVCVVPDATITADGSLKARLLLSTLEGGLTATAGAQIPTQLTFVPSGTDPFSISAQSCLCFTVDWHAKACLIGIGCCGWNIELGCWSDSGNLLRGNYGTGCGPGPCSAGKPCGTTPPAPTPARDDADPPTTSPFHSPSIATSPDGATTLAVYIDNSNPGGYEPDLFYQLDTGSGPSAPQPIWGFDPHMDRDPQIAFLDNDTALLVWTHNVMTYEEASALLDTTEGHNQFMRNEEIFYAVWHAGTWGARTRLTDNSRPDGVAKLTAIAGTGRVWVTWIGYETDDMFTETAGQESMDVYHTAIFVQRLSAAGPDTPVSIITNDDILDPAADFEPTIAFSGQADRGHLFFVRERADGQRNLMHARCDADIWSPPTAVLGGASYPGIDMPSVALGQSINGTLEGIVAFTTRPGNTVLGVNIGMDESVQIARFTDDPAGNTILSTPARLGFNRCQASGSNPAKAYVGRWPQAMYLGDSKFAVGLTSHGAPDGFDADGEVGLATIDFSRPLPQWSLHNLTDDARTDIEVAFVPTLNADSVRTLRTTWDTGHQNNAVGLQNFELLPDVAVKRLDVSSRFAQAGQKVHVSAVLRNDGICASRNPGPPEVGIQLGFVTDQGFQPIASSQILFTAAPGEQQTAEFDVETPIGAGTLRAVALPSFPESNSQNNSAEIVLGIATPTSLQCSAVARQERTAVSLTWQNADLYEWLIIYRDGRPIARLPGAATAYIDARPPTGAHQWSVRGQLGRTLSEPGAATCTITVCQWADFNCDQHVNQADLEIFVHCLTGPTVPYNAASLPSGCETLQDNHSHIAADADFDGDVDQDDFGLFQNAYGT